MIAGDIVRVRDYRSTRENTQSYRVRVVSAVYGCSGFTGLALEGRFQGRVLSVLYSQISGEGVTA
jgi:hypothetical protein